MNKKKRKQNEQTFTQWEDIPSGGRKYFYEVAGRLGWKAHYVKVVDSEENTMEFFQEIYNSSGVLVELHKKFPKDEGHQKV